MLWKNKPEITTNCNIQNMTDHPIVHKDPNTGSYFWDDPWTGQRECTYYTILPAAARVVGTSR